MDTREQIGRIDVAISKVLESVENGTDITKWEMDGISIERKSSFELLNELTQIKKALVKKSSPKSMQFVFGDGR